MTLTRWALVEKRMETVMEPRKDGLWILASEALHAVAETRVDGQRRGLDEALGWIRYLRATGKTQHGSPSFELALDELQLHLDAAMDRLDHGEPITSTSGFRLSEPVTEVAEMVRQIIPKLKSGGDNATNT